MNLWAFSVYDLGLSSEVFWRLSPRQWIALNERRTEENKRADLRAGIIASTIYNMLRGKKGKPKRPRDFMPRDHKKASVPKMLQIVEMINIAMGGKDLRGDRRNTREAVGRTRTEG